MFLLEYGFIFCERGSKNFRVGFYEGFALKVRERDIGAGVTPGMRFQLLRSSNSEKQIFLEQVGLITRHLTKFLVLNFTCNWHKPFDYFGRAKFIQASTSYPPKLHNFLVKATLKCSKNATGMVCSIVPVAIGSKDRVSSIRPSILSRHSQNIRSSG